MNIKKILATGVVTTMTMTSAVLPTFANPQTPKPDEGKNPEISQMQSKIDEIVKLFAEADISFNGESIKEPENQKKAGNLLKAVVLKNGTKTTNTDIANALKEAYGEDAVKGDLESVKLNDLTITFNEDGTIANKIKDIQEAVSRDGNKVDFVFGDVKEDENAGAEDKQGLINVTFVYNDGANDAETVSDINVLHQENRIPIIPGIKFTLASGDNLKTTLGKPINMEGKKLKGFDIRYTANADKEDEELAPEDTEDETVNPEDENKPADQENVTKPDTDNKEEAQKPADKDDKEEAQKPADKDDKEDAKKPVEDVQKPEKDHPMIKALAAPTEAQTPDNKDEVKDEQKPANKDEQKPEGNKDEQKPEGNKDNDQVNPEENNNEETAEPEDGKGDEVVQEDENQNNAAMGDPAEFKEGFYEPGAEITIPNQDITITYVWEKADGANGPKTGDGNNIALYAAGLAGAAAAVAGLKKRNADAEN